MKKLLFLIILTATFLFACNGGENDQAQPPADTTQAEVIPATDTLGTDEPKDKDKPKGKPEKK